MSIVHFCSDAVSPTPCGGNSYGYGAVTDRTQVTCKRCLASLAKRDRAFQRKARRWYRSARGSTIDRSMRAYDSGRARPRDAARAIAAEEGRS